MGKRAGEFLLELFFPPRCAFCRRILREGHHHICADCAQDLPWIEENKQLQHYEFLSNCVSLFWYRDNVRESIRRYKFYSCSIYAKTYAPLLAQYIRAHFEHGFDLITWTPLSERSLKKRGYDQAKLLAQGVAEILGVECVATLRKIRHTKEQSSLHDEAHRRANILGAYEAIAPDLVEGKRLLILDDVITTGSTMSECARVLCMNGAADVLGATVARARDKKERK